MSKAYTGKGQFNDETSKHIEKIEEVLRNEYKRLLKEGYTIAEVYDIINQANNFQRGKYIWDNL